MRWTVGCRCTDWAMTRNLILFASLCVLSLLGFLTVRVLLTEGLDILVVASLVILALMGAGVIGALTAPADD